MTLTVVNREPGSDPIATGVPIWRTCLREVTFADDAAYVEHAGLDDGPRPLVEGDAYRLLLEILCGLQSPMLGETHVIGQLKCRLASVQRAHGWLKRLCQGLLAAARDNRTK